MEDKEKLLQNKLDAIENLVKELRWDSRISKENALDKILQAFKSKYGVGRFYNE